MIGIHWGGVPNEFNGAVFINENVRNFLKQNIEDIHFANDDQPNNPDNPDNPNNPNNPDNPDNGDNNNSENPDAA